ncbi:MAG: PBP1A family penicillin-binding protein [Alphaproteobacteria bacterium]|nr:PBP1A family penicillin-binding protein [Alphaproteobacteria bacterium]
MPPLYPGDPRPQKQPTVAKKTKRNKSSSFFWTLAKALITMGIWGLCALCLAILWFSYDLPDIHQLQQSNRKPSVVMQTQEGAIIGTYGELYEDSVKVSELPPYVYQAILAIEDRRFYHHFGLDFIGLVRAAYTNYQADRVVQGGSTLTQQLGKNFLQAQGLYTVNDRSLRRKIQEAIMALWLEWHFTKEQILTIYLNRVYLGSGAYGIDAAARKYFNRSAKQLNVYQSAVIAGLLKAPSRYSPLSNPAKAYERASVVIHQMAEEGYIQQPERYLAEAKEALVDNPDIKVYTGVKFFTDWIYDQIPSFVPIDQDLIVITTLDESMQKHAEKVCQDYKEMGKELKASEIAIVSMLTDGAVKAMVGGYDYKRSQFNRATHVRQPGSAFKTFVYLAALENGMAPDTMIDDTPVRIGNWAPSSYKWQSRGEVSIREAFARSVNPVTVRLGQMVGAHKIIEVANRLGITSKMAPNLSITLGSMDVTLLQLTASFATFAHHGLAVWPYGIVEIRSKDGKILYRRESGTPVRVIENAPLAGIRDMLHAVVKEGSGRAAKSAVGGKTGSNGDKDALFVGYTDKIVTGVWIGNDDYTDMVKKSTGSFMPTRVWEAYTSGLDLNNVGGEDSSDVDVLIDTLVEGSASTLPSYPNTSDNDGMVDELVNALTKDYPDLPATEAAPGAAPAA